MSIKASELSIINPHVFHQTRKSGIQLQNRGRMGLDAVLAHVELCRLPQCDHQRYYRTQLLGAD